MIWNRSQDFVWPCCRRLSRCDAPSTVQRIVGEKSMLACILRPDAAGLPGLFGLLRLTCCVLGCSLRGLRQGPSPPACKTNHSVCFYLQLIVSYKHAWMEPQQSSVLSVSRKPNVMWKGSMVNGAFYFLCDATCRVNVEQEVRFYWDRETRLIWKSDQLTQKKPPEILTLLNVVVFLSPDCSI